MFRPLFAGERDPELTALFADFAFCEVARPAASTAGIRGAGLAALLGCGVQLPCRPRPRRPGRRAHPGTAEGGRLPGHGLSGVGRTLPSLRAHNEALFKEGVPLPLPGQSTTAAETRREARAQVQVDIFGEGMADFWRSGPEESRHIDRWLAANCFGDYCTRTGPDLRQRELIAFRFLAAQGGCEPQPKSHIAVTLRLGTGQRALTAAPSTTLPYIGYPRSLNALRCIQEADPKNSCPTKREGRTTRGSSGLPLAFGPFCHISGAKARRQARPSFLGQGTLRQSSRVISWHSSRVRRNSSLI